VIKGPWPMHPRQKIKVTKTFLQFLQNPSEHQHNRERHLEQNLQTGGEIIEDPILPLHGFYHSSRGERVTSCRLKAKQTKTYQTLYCSRIKENPSRTYCNTPLHAEDHFFLKYPSTQIHEGSFAPNVQNNLVCCKKLKFRKNYTRALKT